ncbi:hypothetical protein [Actinokineospora sp. NPDC004072]
MTGNDIPLSNAFHAGSVAGTVIQAAVVNVGAPGGPDPGPDRYADVFARLDRVPFTPRGWLTDRLDRFLATAGQGYFLIEGKAGVGKTTLLAHLARQRRWPHHFTAHDPARRLARSARRALADQLTDRFGPLGGGPETPAAFAELLADAAASAAREGTSVVVLVDGIDDGEPVRGCAPLGLPIELPANVHVVATLREGSELFERWGGSAGATIGADTAADDLRAHIDTALADPVLRDRVGDPDGFRERLVDRCAGDFLLLRYLLAEVAAGREVARLPGDLWAYYSWWLRELERDHPAGALAVPLLSALACADEPIGLAALCALSGVDDAGLVTELALTSLQNLVVVTGYHRDLRLSVWHDTVRDYFTGQVHQDAHSGDRLQLHRLGSAAASARERITARYLADPRLDDGYGTRHLVGHLAAAGKHDELHALLRAETDDGANLWFGLRPPREYRADLAVAQQIAAAAADADLAAPRLAPAIGLELRYALMDASVSSAMALGAAPVAPAVVRALVARRVWAPVDALRRIAAVEDPARVVALLTALVDGAGRLAPLDAADAWNLLFPLRDIGAFTLGARLLPMLAEPDRSRITAEFHRMSRIPDIPLRARILGVLGGCGDADALLDAVLGGGDEERSTANAVADLIPHLSDQALARVQPRMTRTHEWSAARRALALRWAESGANPDWVADHAAAELSALAADGIGLVFGADPPIGRLLAALDPARRSHTLNRVLDRIPADALPVRLTPIGRYLDGPALTRALRMARSLNTLPAMRARALAALLPALPPPARSIALDEALADLLDAKTPAGPGLRRRSPALALGLAETVALLAEHPGGRVGRVEEVVRWLPPADQVGPLAALSHHGRDDLRGEALAIIERLSGPARAVALIAVAPHLDRHSRAVALGLVGGVADGRHRTEALDALTAAAGEEDLVAALRTAQVVGDQRQQVAALAALACHVGSADLPRVRAAAEERASEPVIELADVLPPAERVDLLRRAAAALPTVPPVGDPGYFDRLAAVRPVLGAREVVDRLVAAARWRPVPGWPGLDVWAVLRPGPEHVAAARKAVRNRISGGHETAQWIAMLAQHLSQSEVDTHVAAAVALPEQVRHLPLAALAHRLPPDRRDWAAQVALTHMCRVDRPDPHGPASVPVGLDAHAVALLADALPDHSALLDAVLPNIGTTRWPWRLLARLLPRLDPTERERLERAAIDLLPTHIPDPSGDLATIARHTSPAFHRALLAHSPGDRRAAAVTAVLAADPAASWTDTRHLLPGLARPELLTALTAATPLISTHGGLRATAECATAVNDVTRWWP